MVTLMATPSLLCRADTATQPWSCSVHTPAPGNVCRSRKVQQDPGPQSGTLGPRGRHPAVTAFPVTSPTTSHSDQERKPNAPRLPPPSGALSALLLSPALHPAAQALSSEVWSSPEQEGLFCLSAVRQRLRSAALKRQSHSHSSPTVSRFHIPEALGTYLQSCE